VTSTVAIRNCPLYVDSRRPSNVSNAQKAVIRRWHGRRRARRPRRGARCTRAGKRYPLHRSRISDVQARPVVFRLTEGFYNPAPSFGAGRGDGAVTALRSIAGRLLAAPCAIHRANNAYGRHYRLSASTVLMGHSQEFDQAAVACPNMASGRR
jgi:hypothetical protein